MLEVIPAGVGPLARISVEILSIQYESGLS